MKKKFIKMMDLIIWIVFCIFLGIRVFYPKQYPPLDWIFPILFILLIIIIIVLKINDVAYNWKNDDFDFSIQTIKVILFIIPVIIALIRTFG